MLTAAATRWAPTLALASVGVLLVQACAAVPPPVAAPDAAVPWPTAPQPRRTPLPLPEPTAAPPTGIPSPTRGPADFVGRQRTRVLRVWDGQSVLVENGLTVRYLGLQAPSGGAFGRPVQPYGREAAQRNAELVEGKEIELEQDVTDVDADGQLPRYVYVDGHFVNQELLLAGLANAAPRPPDVRYQDQLAEAERAARETRRGVWASAPTLTRTPVARPAQTPRPAPPARTDAPPAPAPAATPAVTPTGGPTGAPATRVLATPVGGVPTAAPRSLPPTAALPSGAPSPAPLPPPRTPLAATAVTSPIPRFGEDPAPARPRE